MPAWFVAPECPDDEQRSIAHRIFGRTLPRRDLGAAEEAPFGSRAVLRTMPDIGLMCCFLPRPRWRLAERATSEIMLVRPADGRMTVIQDGSRCLLEARNAVLVRSGRVASFEVADTGRIDAFTLPEAALAETGVEIDAVLMRPIASGNHALRLFGHYAAGLLRGLLPLETRELQRLAVDHLRDLMAVAVQTVDEIGAGPQSARSRRASRFEAIKMDVDLRIARRDLSAELIARLHHVTPRYVQKLFQAEGLTFSHYVRDRRLERALQLLAASRPGDRTVSDIAYEVGFGDLSYFNRVFRARFGHPPSSARDAAAGRSR